MTKKIIAKILMVVMVFNLLAVCVLAEDGGQENVTAVINKEIKFIWNNEEFKPLEPASQQRVYAIMYNDRTYIPARFIAEKAGITVNWESDTQSVLFDTTQKVKPPKEIETLEVGYGSFNVQVVLNKDIKFVWDGVEFQPTDPVSQQRVYAIMYNDRTYIPARFIAEKAGITVSWGERTQTVMFNLYGENNPKPTPTPTPVADTSEFKSVLTKGFVFNGANILGYADTIKNSTLRLDSAEIEMSYSFDGKTEQKGTFSDIFENDNPKDQIKRWRYAVKELDLGSYGFYLKSDLEAQGFVYTVPIKNNGMMVHKFSKDSTEIFIIYETIGGLQYTFLFTKK